MKKKGLSLTLWSATLFLVAAHADVLKTAAPAAPVTPAARDAASADLLKRYDTNHDGKLDENELATAHEEMLKGSFNGPTTERGKKFRATLVKRFDRNGDGQLDETEKAAMKKYFLEHFDKNGDGRLDDDERAAMREQLKADAKAGKFKNQ